MNLAPIVLFVYNRPWHTKQTVEALQKNELAIESEVFIYSDEAKNEDAQKNVDEVRKYIDKIDGFKKVTVTKRENRYMKFVKRLINGPMIGSNNVDILLSPHPRKVNVDSKLIDIYTYHLEDRWRENDIKINNDYFFEPIWKAEY